MAEPVDLPPGFVLDDMPEGFVLDDQPQGFRLPTPDPSLTLEGQFTGPDPAAMRAMGDIAGTMASGMLAEPLAGVAGSIGTLFQGPETGAETVRAVRGALTADLEPETVQAIQGGISNIPAPIRRTVAAAAEQFDEFADMAADAFGPGAGAAVRTAPVAVAEVIGFKGARQVLRASNQAATVSRRTMMKELRDAAPSIDQLKAASRGIYREIDDAGAFVQRDHFANMARQARAEFTNAGGRNPRVSRPATAALLDIENAVGGDVPLEDLVQMRQVLRNVASSPDPLNAAPAAAALDVVDGFIDGIKPGSLIGSNVQQVGGKLRLARELWRRSKRSELLEEAWQKAQLQASGVENVIRTQFRSILNNKRQRQFFKAEELDEMRRVVMGGKGANLLRTLGKLGFGEIGSAGVTNTVGATAGAGIGFFLGDTTGMVVVPVLGTVSRSLAQRLTRNNARFANDILRSGVDANQIVAAYMRHTPASRRTPQELAQLLIRPDIPLTNMSGTPLTSRAALLAALERQRRLQAAGAIAAGSVASQAQEQ